MRKRILGRRFEQVIFSPSRELWLPLLILLLLALLGGGLVGWRKGDCLWLYLLGILIGGGIGGWVVIRIFYKLIRLLLSLIDYFHRFELRNRHPRRRVKKFKVYVKPEPEAPHGVVHEEDFNPPLEPWQDWDVPPGGLPGERLCQVKFWASIETVDGTGDTTIERETPLFEAPYGIEDCVVTLDTHDRLIYTMWYIDEGGNIVAVPPPDGGW